MSALDSIKQVFQAEKRWWQVSLSLILLGGIGLVVWLIRTQEMEFIYSLF